MTQTELFPNDIVRFAMSLTTTEVFNLRLTQPGVHHRIREIRRLVNEKAFEARRLEEHYAKKLERALYS